MAYFESLAAELDKSQMFIDYSRVVEANRLNPYMPYTLADRIAQNPRWKNLPSADDPSGGYMSKIAGWVRAGITFNVFFTDCCKSAEQYLVESVRLAQGKDPIDSHLVENCDVVQPAIIFTVGNVAVGYRKSLGNSTTYGLRDSPEHGIGAELLFMNEFTEECFWHEDGQPIVYELGEDQLFKPVRPTVATFPHDERAQFCDEIAAGKDLLPIKRAALTMNHDDIVSSIDRVVKLPTTKHVERSLVQR